EGLRQLRGTHGVGLRSLRCSVRSTLCLSASRQACPATNALDSAAIQDRGTRQGPASRRTITPWQDHSLPIMDALDNQSSRQLLARPALAPAVPLPLACR